MKHSFVALAFFGFAQAAVSAPISCGGKSEGYSILAAGNSATLKLNHHAIPFGTLACFTPASAMVNGPFKVCNSQGVRDDGYSAVFSTDAATAQTVVTIGKVWKGGTRTLAVLPCAVALNR